MVKSNPRKNRIRYGPLTLASSRNSQLDSFHLISLNVQQESTYLVIRAIRKLGTWHAICYQYF